MEENLLRSFGNHAKTYLYIPKTIPQVQSVDEETLCFASLSISSGSSNSSPGMSAPPVIGQTFFSLDRIRISKSSIVCYEEFHGLLINELKIM